MTIPNFQQLMLPVLKLIGEGKQTIPESIPSLADQFNLTEEETNELLPSGKQTYLANRAHWARNYMSQAGLIVSVKRGSYVLSESGRALLSENPPEITKLTLKRFEPFRLWIQKDERQVELSHGFGALGPNAQVVLEQLSTPEDSMATASRALDAALQDELLAILIDIPPVRFERLILDLLAAMGYGAGDLGNTHMTKTTGDGGIDGIIHEDALGLDAVYIQAKRYAPGSNVGRPAIQQFVGSLTGEGATKGVFVTSSDFSAEARAYLSRVQHRIILINGQELARLMIKHGVGVRTRTTYMIKGVDADYFDDLSAG